MSLLGSIFGEKAEERADKSSSVATIFDRKIEIPPPKPLPPAAAPKIEEDKEDQGTNKTVNDKKKRKHEHLEAEDEPDTKEQTEEKETAANEQDAEERTVFVGNLPLNTTRKSLAKLFKDCGKVESTRIRSVAVTGVKLPPEKAGDQNLVKKVSANTQKVDADAKSSVQGYVVFSSKESVPKALKLNNTRVADGQTTGSKRLIRVDHSNPTYDASRSVFVGNLPYSADEESLRRHFCEGCDLDVTEIEGVRVVRDKESFRCKGFGYVLFQDRGMAAAALRRMHGTMYMKRELRVMVCGRRFKGKSGASPKKKKRSSEARGSSDKASAETVGALKRILNKKPDDKGSAKKKRARATKKPNKQSVKKAGVSKRAALEAKAGKRVKKIQKRISKGMGKGRK